MHCIAGTLLRDQLESNTCCFVVIEEARSRAVIGWRHPGQAHYHAMASSNSVYCSIVLTFTVHSCSYFAGRRVATIATRASSTTVVYNRANLAKVVSKF